MSVKIFYSWQSDQPQNRAFVRSAIGAAIKELRQDLSLEEAQRDIVADQDTQGVPGSPGIAEAILTKIRAADVFVADLTFISKTSSDDTTRHTPNPNVMLEYGYALHALGDGKIIGIFNEAHGSPKELPFDLAHRRWPIRFNLASTTANNNADQQKKNLKDTLKLAIKAIISQYDETPLQTPLRPVFISAEAGDGVGRLRSAQDFLCFDSHQDKPIWLRTGPYSFLRLIPTVETLELGEVEAYKIAQANLQPMGAMRGGGWSTGRHTTGAVVYWTIKDAPQTAWDASQLFLTRELWANDFYHVVSEDRERAQEVGFSFIPTGAFEEVFIDTLINFVAVASKPLGLSLPVRIIAGLGNVQGLKLAVDPNYFRSKNFEGTILRPNLIWEATLTDWTVDPFDFLVPFFERVYDIAGLSRPRTRTTGRRQR
jgi:hypothetical protein